MTHTLAIWTGLMLCASATLAHAKLVCHWQGDPLPARVAAAQEALAEAHLSGRSAGDFAATVIDGDTTAYLLCAATTPPRVTPDTRFEVGSLSKIFTGLVLAQAVTDGRVRLDDDVRTYLPGGYDGLAFNGKPVTLGHLANMTSGLPDDLPARTGPASTAEAVWQRHAVLAAYGRDDFFRDLKSQTLTAEPGHNPAHSNVASILLGYVLADTYAAPYRTLVVRAVEAPAGMTGTASAEADSLNAEGQPMPRLSAIGYATAAGGLAYTPSDLGRFMRYLLHSPAPAVTLSLQPTWTTLDGNAAITLGWIWRRQSAAGPVFQASGGTFGFASQTSLYRTCGIGLSFVQNASDDDTQAQLAALSDGFAAAVAGQDGRSCGASAG